MLLAIVGVALVGVLIQIVRLRQVVQSAPVLGATGDEALEPAVKVAVIIPAYNEAGNIEGCVTSVLLSQQPGAGGLEVWVVDDQSSDATLAIARSLQQTLKDPRLHILAGQTRPSDQRWMGKNWACVQGAQQATGEFLLFLDADVRLEPGAIAAAIQTMQTEQIDLLTLCPEVQCGCLAEWLVQPLILTMLAIGFDFSEVNDPNCTMAFAVGQFMLFRCTAYETLGGHWAVASEVVEDVELARRVKEKGLRLKYVLGRNLATVRMYDSWAAIWEGWTKNWHLGSRRNLPLSLYSAVVTFWLCTVPWLVLIFLLIQGMVAGLNWLGWLTVAVAFTGILLQYGLRQAIQRICGIPTNYWWLTGMGGVLVSAIALASIIKTETGWGWTWRGRSLKLPDVNP